MVSYCLYLIAASGVRHLPRAISAGIATLVTLLFYVFKRNIRNNVKRNLEMLCDDQCNAFDVFRNFSRTIMDFLSLSPDRPEELDRRCRIVGIEHLDEALAKGKGAIIFTAHQGPWEVSGAYLSSKGYRIHTIAREHMSSRVTDYFSRMRNAWGIRVYSTGEGVDRLIEALRGGDVIVLLIDRRFSTKGVALSFLGREVLLPQGHVILHQRTGAPLLPSCCWYDDAGSIVIRIDRPIETEGAPVEEVAQRCIDRIEDFIKPEPEQWFAFDHLWPEVQDE
jgi:lauroyl/myristoyl acyltransferase